MRPRLSVRAFSVPKAGASAEENEDAWAGPVASADGLGIAIADGATESVHARWWADLLAREAAAIPEPSRAIDRARAGFTPDRKSLAWYAEAKLAEGAHAAVLALHILSDGRWTAWAIGDCTLLRVEEGSVTGWPTDDPAEFDNRPALVSSDLSVDSRPITCGGTWVPGDRFILATDALAAHMLAVRTPLNTNSDQGEFEAYVASARANGLRNDDTTLVEVDIL